MVRVALVAAGHTGAASIRCSALMPKRPWYPKNTGDYVRDTRHLSLEEHGAYNLLMDFYWDRGPLVDNSELLPTLRRIWGVSLQKTRKIWQKISIFFYEKDGVFRHKRIDEEIAEAEHKQEFMAEIGAKGGRRSRKRTQCNPDPDTRSPYLGSTDQKGESSRNAEEGSEPPGDSLPPPAISIPLIPRDGEFPIHLADVREWQETFPAVDVMAALRHIRQWSKDNPERRKTEAGVRRFITRWLAKAQDSGEYPKDGPRGPGGGRSAPRPRGSVEDANARAVAEFVGAMSPDDEPPPIENRECRHA